MASPGFSGELNSTRDENGLTWRGRGKQTVLDYSPDRSVVDSVFDNADEHQAQTEPVKQPTSQCGNAFAQDGQVESEDEELSKAKRASDDIVSCGNRSRLRKRKDSTASTKIPQTPISRPGTPQTSRPATPHTSRSATPYTSRLASPHSSASNTPNVSTPATPHTSGPRKLDHLPQTPHKPKSKAPGQQLSTPPSPKPRQNGHSPTTKPTAANLQPSNPHRAKHLGPRHFRSTPQLNPPKKHPHLPSSLTSPPYNSPPPRPYTFPPRRFLKSTAQIRRPTSHNTTSRRPPRRPTHPSICTHVDLSLHWDQRSMIEGGTRYRCRCKPSTLRSRASKWEFQWIDGAAQLFYPDAPPKVEWYYCSDGEGHIIRSSQEAVDHRVAELETVDRSVAKLETVSRLVPKGKGHMTDAQLEQLEVVEWGGTETALRKQRDCLWLRGRLSKLKCFSWTRRDARKRS